MIRIGIVLIGLAVAALLYTRTFNWQPVRLPLNIQKDNTASVTFTADMSATYFVQIDLQRKLPFEELGAIQGAMDNPKSTPYYKGLRLPRVLCTVFNKGQEIKYGSYKGRYWGQNVGAIVRSFPATSGQKYTVRANIKGGATRFQNTNPHLGVRVFREPVAFGADDIMVLEAFCNLVLWIGLAITVVSAFKTLRSKRSQK